MNDPTVGHAPSMSDWRLVWAALSLLGECDWIDGHEYVRITQEWEDQGRPTPMSFFIRSRANQGGRNL